MVSCEETKFYLVHCPNVEIDGMEMAGRAKISAGINYFRKEKTPPKKTKAHDRPTTGRLLRSVK
jgi:hypothetical protein